MTLPAVRLAAVDGDDVPIIIHSVVVYDTATPATVGLPSSGLLPEGGDPRYIVNDGPADLTVVGLTSTVLASGQGVLVVLGAGPPVNGWLVVRSSGATTITAPAIPAIGYAVAGTYNTFTVFSYNPIADHWSYRPDCPVSIRNGAFGLSSKVFAFSANLGSAGGGEVGTYEFNPDTDVWTQRANTPEQVQIAPSAGGYIAGGGFATAAVHKTHKYDAGTDGWTTLANTPSQFFGVPAVLEGSTFVVFSGSTRRYNTGTDVWSAGATPGTTYGAGATAVLLPTGVAVVVGGLVSGAGAAGSPAAVVQRYDVGLDSWAAGPFAPQPIALSYRFGFEFSGKAVFACGYRDPISEPRTQYVHEYDPTLDSWVALGSFPVPKSGGNIGNVTI